jgi:hypothetical protein
MESGVCSTMLSVTPDQTTERVNLIVKGVRLPAGKKGGHRNFPSQRKELL